MLLLLLTVGDLPDLLYINPLTVSNVPRQTSVTAISQALRARPSPDTETPAARNALCDHLPYVHGPGR